MGAVFEADAKMDWSSKSANITSLPQNRLIWHSGLARHCGRQIMRIVFSFLGTGLLILSYFSSGHIHASLQEEGQPDLAGSQSTGVPSTDVRVYAPDSDHIWNRLFRLFYVRRPKMPGCTGVTNSILTCGRKPSSCSVDPRTKKP